MAWTIAGVSMGIVFVILLLLVLILSVFNWLAGGKAAPAAPAAAAPAAAPVTAGNASGSDEVAVATAVFLYLNGRHDEESGVLTIHVNEHSLWHEELNDRL